MCYKDNASIFIIIFSPLRYFSEFVDLCDEFGKRVYYPISITDMRYKRFLYIFHINCPGFTFIHNFYIRLTKIFTKITGTHDIFAFVMSNLHTSIFFHRYTFL